MADEHRKTTRREFLKIGSASIIGLTIGALFPRGRWLEDEVYAIPASEGYLLVDTKKCQGCSTCMLACSLAHEGKHNMSLARIQVQQNPLLPFPYDVKIDQCRQCAYPPCVESCPTKALHVDEKNGNIRVIDPNKCIGCQRCIEACPYETSSTTWNHIDTHTQKCDLCVYTPYWEEKGGVNGKQACVEVCPVGAIRFTKEVPIQTGDIGYKVNLRREDEWGKLGWPTD